MASLKHNVLASPSPDSVLASIPTSPASPFYLIFFASISPATSQSWCPDCTSVEGIINKFVPVHSSAVVYVGQRPEWKTPDNVFRKAFRLTAIPTVIKVEAGTQQELLDQLATAPRLVERQITATALEAFVKV